ncbi:PGF-pre-PGF domain-containing protein [Halogeometricum limi]|uniref:PGF-CTERM protein/PGF-pre-PGF domain-containing protein n=1 Tax=Halogeometricum limi TaxID=555875 RepID=A0A1I6GKS3_9EURY|nr:PGF-pre-PGF domain-containing protein [Halogeometricum limi]SFR42770.1 PGF-CTERM protein/PGF-pre-PGF domain-containing protein [Halogeometricum limi]
MKQRDRAVVVTVAALVVLASLGPVGFAGLASANGPTPTVPGQSPGVNATTTTWDPGTDANVTVAYNVTGASDPANTTLWLLNDSGFATDYDTDLTGDTGERNLTYGGGAAFGDTPVQADGARRVWVRTYDQDESAFEAEGVAVVHTSSNVTVDSYSLSSTPVAPGVTTDLFVELNNTGETAETFRVAAYPETGDADALNSTVVSVPASSTQFVTLPVTFTEQYRGQTVNFTVNDEPTTTVAVNDAAPTPDVSGQCQWYTPCTGMPDKVNANRNASVDVPVRVNLTGSVSLADANLTLSGPNGLVAYNDSLTTLNGTTTFTLPARPAAGSYRLETDVVNDSTGDRVSGSFSMATVQVVGNTSVGRVNVSSTTLKRAQTHEVSVRVDNTGDAVENHTVFLYPSEFRTTPLAQRTFTVKPGQSAEGTINVSFPAHFDTDRTYNLSTGNFAGPEITLEPLVTMESLTHVGGTANTSELGTSTIAPSDDGGLLQFDLTYETLESDRPQNLNGSGLDESSRFEVVLSVPHSYEPAVLLATAHNVSWSVQNTSDDYEVTVVGQPINAAYKVDGPKSVSDWENLSAEQDVATHAYTPMFSLAFLDNESTSMDGISGMVVASDAQSATFPYPGMVNGSPTLNVELAAPHETTDGENNTGRYEALVPAELLDTWGVSDPNTLAGTYKGDGVALSPTVTDDGDVRISFPTTYSTGTVQLSPDAAAIGADDGSSGDGSSGDDSSGDTGDDGGDSTSSPPSDTDDTDDTDDSDDSTDTQPVEETPDTTDSNDTDDRRTVEATPAADGRSASAKVTNASANETVEFRIPDLNASETAVNAAEAANATENVDGESENETTNRSNERSQVRKLGLNLSDDAAEVGVNVSSHEEVPEGTPELDRGDAAEDGDGDGASGGAIDYVSIDLSGTTDDAVENATITFDVPASKLDARGISPSEVRLYRYHDGEWQRLNTTYLGNETYEAETPGFSVFAVGSERADGDSEDESATETQTPAQTATQTATETAAETATATESASTDRPTETETGVPGFGAPVALVSILLTAVVARLRR